jgi:zinc transport system substrate-binding protein
MQSKIENMKFRFSNGKYNSIVVGSILLILFTGIISSCKNLPSDDQKKIISVSILPQKFFVEKIAGDLFEINVLIPPGASPASYDPAPKQIMDLSNSVVYFKIGYIEFEKNWMNHFTNEYPDLIIADLSEGISILSEEYDHGDHWHEPHIWMSTHNAEIIAKNIFNTLQDIDAENTEYYKANYHSFIEELTKLDEYIMVKTISLTKRDFIIYHPALTYFAEEYNFNQISIEHEGKEPAPGDMGKIIDMAVEKKIQIIFTQKQFDIDNAKQIANEINGKVVTIDPLAYDWDKQLMHIADELGGHDNY